MFSVHPFEIGSRGYISPSNKANLKKTANPVLVSKKCAKIYQALQFCHTTFLENEKR